MKRRKPKPATPVKPLPLPIWCFRGGPMDGKAGRYMGMGVIQYVLGPDRRTHQLVYKPTAGHFVGKDNLLVIIAGLTKREERLWKRIALKP